MEPRQIAPAGTNVYGADGDLLGAVQSSDDAYLVVDSGDVPPAWYVPIDSVVETREDGVYLSATRDDAAAMGWGELPAAEEELEGGETTIEPASDYSAIQGEDSLDDDPMPVPGSRE